MPKVLIGQTALRSGLTEKTKNRAIGIQFMHSNGNSSFRSKV